jgi:hypothetical protein
MELPGATIHRARPLFRSQGPWLFIPDSLERRHPANARPQRPDPVTARVQYGTFSRPKCHARAPQFLIPDSSHATSDTPRASHCASLRQIPLRCDVRNRISARWVGQDAKSPMATCVWQASPGVPGQRSSPRNAPGCQFALRTLPLPTVRHRSPAGLMTSFRTHGRRTSGIITDPSASW